MSSAIATKLEKYIFFSGQQGSQLLINNYYLFTFSAD